MKDMLFKSVEQKWGPATASETTFEFLQRGGRKEAVATRQWIESWFQAVPDDQKRDIEKRLKSKHFKQFLGAMFELEVHEIFKRLGCVIEIEPGLASSNGKVDFRILDKGKKFYIEATVCGIGQGTLCANENEQDAAEKLRKHLEHPHSNLWLSATGDLCTTLSKRRVVEPFENLLNRYTADDVRKLYSESGQEIARQSLTVEIREDGWVLRGYLCPPRIIGSQGQIYGPSRSGAMDGSRPLAKALARKAKDWSKKDFKQEVFLIAVNVCHPEFVWHKDNTIHVRRALFANPGEEGQHGDFCEALSYVNGVIMFDNAVLGNEMISRVRLFKNGNATIPECLSFLLQDQRLGDLLGLSAQ